MGYRIREIEAETKFCEELTIEAISRVLPKKTIEAALAAENVKATRVRKLDFIITVFIVIGMSLYPMMSIGHVMQKLGKGLRFLWPDPEIGLVKDSGISYRRYKLGAKVMQRLFQMICQPIATEKTRGAFLFGLRLMAIDGTEETVADTPTNEAAFGRHKTGRGKAGYPQVQNVYLAECGTHVIVDAGFWPIHTSERVGGHRMLRSVTEGMLLMWDRGFHSYDMLVAAKKKGAQILGRLPAHVKPEVVRPLSDGSYLAYLKPSDYKRRKQGERCLVRVIEYRVTDPALADPNELHRLVTTLLDADLYPLHELVCAFHERWEIEIAIDEIKTHQRLSQRTLRSLKPVGVIQELYGLLLAHFIIRFLMHEAALLADVDPDRLSFVHALEVVKDSISEFQMVARSQLTLLYQRLLRDIARGRLPKRRNRINPRVVKCKMSKFLKKRPEHYAWPQPSADFRDSISPVIHQTHPSHEEPILSADAPSQTVLLI